MDRTEAADGVGPGGTNLADRPLVLLLMAHRYQVEPEPGVLEELRDKGASFESLVKEAKEYLDDPDVETLALARMFIERGFSEKTSYWLVREADVERAPGTLPDAA